MFFNKSNLYGIIVISAILLTVSAQFTPPSFAEEDEYLPYDIPLKGLFMEYPSDWIVQDEDLAEPLLTKFVLVDDQDTVSASIAVMNIVLEVESSSIEVANEFVEGMKGTQSELMVQQEGNIKIDDHTSRQKIVTYAQPLGQIKQDIVFTVIDNHAYVFLFSSFSEDYAKFQPIFNTFLNSIEITPETIPQLVDSTYADSKVKAQFPEDWITIKSVSYEEDRDAPINMIMSFPPSVAAGNGGIENVVSIALGYSDNDAVESNSYFDSITSSGCYLVTDNISIIKLNNMKTMEFKMNCTPPGYDQELEAMGYVMISEKNTLFLLYMAAEKLYDMNFDRFEEFKKTVNIENTLDLSDFAVIASVYDMKIKQEQLKITDSSSLPVNLYEDSEIRDFNFDMKDSTISFQPMLNSEEYFQMDIETDGLLEPPYAVDISGEYADYFIVEDKSNDKTTISVFAESPTGIVTIKGKLHENLTESTSSDSSSVPSWIKSNAEFWAQDKIDDATFISGIQFLIKNGILDVPSTASSEQGEEGQSNEIPAWIKSNAEFWAQGLISDDDFLSGMQYLVQQGIIKV